MNEVSTPVLTRVWAMPNKWTFRIPVIASLVRRYAKDGIGWADPFAGQSTFGSYRNDLNPLHHQPSQVEAEEFLRTLLDTYGAGSLSGVIFDPPYSLTQVSRSYNDMGLKFRGKENPTGGFPRCRDLISQLLIVGGHAICFGWNTVGVGKTRGFELVELLDVCHGGNRNDTLCTVERKRQVQQ